MDQYDHIEIEKKWQQKWLDSGIFHMDPQSTKPKFYSLIEFPFPSGEGMHVGHLRSNTAMDIISRKRRAEGFNVLYPIGWDAFGLPTENYALKTGVKPKDATQSNTDNFRRQLQSAGFSFDWSREINTTDPKYYRWTQWIFLQMLKYGLAYKTVTQVNWCPKDKTVLANEEVIQGLCERCGTQVEKRDKNQWMLAITKYAERLDKDLDDVDYPERVKIQQRNWIGKSEGSEISFELFFTKNPSDNDRRGPNGEKAAISVFTTRADTLYGATYLVLSPEHLWITLATDDTHDVLENKDEVKAYVEAAKNKLEIDRTNDEKEKTGVELKGVKAIHSITGQYVPVFVADYVLVHYGTGAIMAVPAHDSRDFDFAKKYNLPIKEVIEPLFVKSNGEDGVQKEKPFKKRHAAVAIVKHWSEDKYLCLKWKQTDWRGFVIGGIEEGETPADAAKREIIEETGYTSPTYIRDCGGVVHAQFFHKIKNENRSAHFHPVYFELANGNRTETTNEEKEIHDVVWISKEEVDSFLDWVTDMRLIWHRASNPNSFPDKSALTDASRVTQEGILVNSGKFDGMQIEQAKKALTEAANGKIVTRFKLRDWVFSRQRYWGEPIPVIHCEKCGIIPVPEAELPVILPEVEKYQPTDNGESPLAVIAEWVNVSCPQCNGPAKRETDTMPQWAGSSWYFLRYIDPKNDEVFASKEILKNWMPVDWYNGGMEHTTLHLLYSRFWNKFLFDIGQVPTSEPYAKRTSHGLILAEGGEKMSKSKGNSVIPDKIIEQVGADSLRLYEMFMGPFEQAVSWSVDGIVGPRRFIERVWNLAKKVSDIPSDNKLVNTVNKAVAKISQDIENMKFNTAVSSLMVLSNEFEKVEHFGRQEWQIFLQLLAPFVPHVTEELWQKLGKTESISFEPWPKPQVVAQSEDELITIIIQVNGKMRDSIEILRGESKDTIKLEQLIRQRELVKKWLESKKIIKIITVPGRLVNIVVQ